jgi:alpha-N-arabinofuranosidase
MKKIKLKILTMRKILLSICGALCAMAAFAQNQITLNAELAKTQISKHIYGHFAEHLGRCIYDGFYVGDKNTKIPNTGGVRNDVIKALKDLQIPNLRWPGGCFADTYHWKDAIGPKDKRKPIENLAWGNYREDNSFGTNEFLDLCELLGAEPYLATNMNTGTVQEAVEWVQYVNSKNGTGYLTDMRAANGRSKPWNVKYWGIGNESWDCGGDMRVEHYLDLYRQYATAMTSYGNTEKLFRIAVGPGSPNHYHWTEEIMKNLPAKRFEGISIHHYSVIDWSQKGSSDQFSDKEYFITLEKAWFMEEFVRKNKEMMDKYDPEKRVALIVDEWGGWYETDPEGKGALYQQNTIRDAMIAGLTLNIFNNNADRVRMANLAQTVNVLQSVILTKEEKMVLTPTYHVMEMYKVHQDATMVPVQLVCNDFVVDGKRIPAISVSASIDKAKKMHVSLVNLDNTAPQKVELTLKGATAAKVTGRVLTSAKVQDGNTFENPNKVTPKAFSDFSFANNVLTVNMPKNAVVVLELGE